VIVGEVRADGVPIVRLEVGGNHWTAIVDTGFNGDLELPERLRPQVNAQFICRIRSFLAANRIIEEDSYLVEIPFDGQTMTAEATFVSGDEILIGTHLLRRYVLEIDFRKGTLVLRQGE
jgi:clan AA aspartic protease